MVSLEHALVVASILLLLSILSSKTSSRLGIPALVLFLFVGMLAGSDGPGGIYFDNALAAQSLGIIALVLILFSGGMDTEWQIVRPVLASGVLLSTLGVCLTAVLVGFFAAATLGFSLGEGLLLGAVVSCTDAAAVFSVLRSRGVGLRGQLKPLLELESGSNDPMAVLLTVAILQVLTGPAVTVPDLVLLLVRQVVLGGGIGWAMGRAMAWLVNRLQLEYEGLYPVLTLTLVLLTYGGTAALGGNGFLAVYLAGLTLGNCDFIHRRTLLQFHDGLAWVMQIAMFLALGLLVFPSHLPAVIPSGAILAAFLILVARPLAVLVCLWPARMTMREKALVSWVGLRGAAPIILATFPLVAGVARAPTIFNLVFFIVLASVLLQGTTIPLVARWLGVDARVPPPRWQAQCLPFLPAESPKSELVELAVPVGSGLCGRQLLDVGLPKGALLVLIVGGAGEHIVPHGGTVLQGGDTLYVLGDRDSLAQARALICRAGGEMAV